MLQFFGNCQQQNTDDHNGDKGIGFPGELFLQEDPGQQQGDDTDGGQDGRGHRIHTAQGVDIGELTRSLEHGSQDLVGVLGHSAELDTPGLDECDTKKEIAKALEEVLF